MKTKERTWTETQKRAVWEKGYIIPGYDENVYRKDFAGAWMVWFDYADTTSEVSYGWEIGHVKPESLHGRDDIDNLQPVHWVNNKTKGENYPYYTTMITSFNKQNVHREQKW